MRPVLRALAAALLLSGCRAPVPAGPAPAPARALSAADTAFFPPWSKSAVIYEVNVRQFTPEGTLAAIEPHLPRLKALGVDVLWIMPVQPIGVEGRKGTLGSYYSIRDYLAVNPEFGSMADFRHLVDAAHREGMRVLLDWVPNHTARDHPWTREHRDWYTLRPDGTISYPLDQQGKETDWTDVADLNYANPRMRAAMISAMRWWLENTGIDGFRTDVAWGVPYDFWAEARRALTAVRPDLFLLAEAEDPQLHAWFHATYGWELHHLLNDLAQGKRPTSALDDYFAEQNRVFGRDAYRMYFTSNHDENSWAGTEFERMGPNHVPAFVLAATVQNSFPLLYTGQEASLSKRLRFFEKDTVDWSGPSLAPFYRSIFELKHSQPALANGPRGGDQVALATTGGDRVYAFERVRGASVVVVAVNFGDAPARASYRGLRFPGTYTDWVSRSPVTLDPAGELEIPAHGYRVLVR
jgi:glycosidase